MMSNMMGYQQQTSYPASFGAPPSISIPATDEEIAAIENAELMKKLVPFGKEMQRGRQTGTENEKIKWWKTQPVRHFLNQYFASLKLECFLIQRCSRCKGHNVTCKPKSGSWAVRCGSCISNPNDGPCSNVDEFREWRIKHLLHLTDSGFETLLQEHKKHPPPPVQAKAEPLSDSEMNLASNASQSLSVSILLYMRMFMFTDLDIEQTTKPTRTTARSGRASHQQYAQASGSTRTGSDSPLSDSEGADTDAAFRVPSHVRVDPNMLPSRPPSSRLAVLSRPAAEDAAEPRSPRRSKLKLTLSTSGVSLDDIADGRSRRNSIVMDFRDREPLEPFMAPLIQPDVTAVDDIPDEVIPVDISPEELRRQLAETRKKLKQQERALEEQRTAKADAQRRYEASQYLLQAKTDRTVVRENELSALQQRVADLTTTREKDRLTHSTLRRNITDIIKDRDHYRKESHRLQEASKDLETQIAVLQQMGGGSGSNGNQTIMVDEMHNGRVEGLPDILKERTRLREELRGKVYFSCYPQPGH